ncbi:hypothetical protein [Halostreptopolyspora alba]|uniref:Uncharacterized protein n=1 Tax=Halostreptopolyspora alba TaxID=2487137 RepID=A0A3N0EC86_9ACTN|nr:hypothetical protein EFW17_08090 [Nocardiopsaceae bacterium YIM 96095]
MNAQTRSLGSVMAVRSLGALDGGTQPAQRRLAADAVRAKHGEDYAESGISAGHTEATVRPWLPKLTESMPAEETPRPKGAVGWCPRSVPT